MKHSGKAGLKMLLLTMLIGIVSVFAISYQSVYAGNGEIMAADTSGLVQCLSDNDGNAHSDLQSGTVYTTLLYTSLYKDGPGSSKTIHVWYNTEMTLPDPYYSGWNRVKFRGKTYYIWLTDYEKKLTNTNAVKKSYNKFCTKKVQKEILKCALSFTNDNTAYAFRKADKQGTKRNGKYYFGCSGFASYVTNKVMQKRVSSYYLTSDLTKLAKPQVLASKGRYGKIRSKVICTGKLTGKKLKKLKVGDILLFKMMENDSRKIDHAAIYIGNNQIVQCTRAIKGYHLNSGLDKDGGVCIAPLTETYKSGFRKAIRVLP